MRAGTLSENGKPMPVLMNPYISEGFAYERPDSRIAQKPDAVTVMMLA